MEAHIRRHVGHCIDRSASRPTQRWRTLPAMVLTQHACADPYERANAQLLQLLVILVGFNLPLRFGMSATVPAVLALAPLWVRPLRRYPLAPLIVVVAVAAVPSGLVLGALSSVDHDVDPTYRAQGIALLLSGVAGLIVILWARQELSIQRVLVLFGVGALASHLLAGQTSWKFDLAVPTTLIVLGLVGRSSRRAAPALALIGLGVLGILDESRAFFGFCLLAATLTAWQMRPRSHALNRWYPAMLIAGLASATYFLAAALLTGGYLGSELQERSTEQIETSGSILAGGRPEWAATRELIKLSPAGYGVGVVPAWEDVRAGRAGLSTINVELEPVRERYMFGGQFKLHSITADLWVSYGWVGVALAVLMLVGLVGGLSFSLATRQAPPAVIFMSLLGIWHMLLGPIFSNWLEVCVSLGVVLAARDDRLVQQRAPRGTAASLPRRAPD